MKKLILSLMPVILLGACENVAGDPKWSQDCERYSSLDSREEDQCKKRNPESNTSGVRIDANNINRVDQQNIGKGR